MRRKGSLLGLVIVVVSLLGASTAHAAFPGQNGKIAFARWELDNTTNIYTMNPDGSAQSNITSFAYHDLDPAWSPDGRRIAFSTNRDGDHSTFEIYTMNPDGTGLRRLTNNAIHEGGAQWSPDGTQLVFSATSPPDTDGEIWVMNADGTGRRQITDNAFPDGSPDWSPDGSTIVFSSERSPPTGCATGNYDLYVMNRDGTNQTRIRESVWEYAADADWSPGGEKIAYSDIYSEDCDGGSFSWVYSINADGSGAVELASPAIYEDENPAWSPDGQKIAWQSDRADGDVEIWTMNPDGTNKTQLTDATTASYSRQPDWQPLPHQSSPAPAYDHPRLAGPIKLSLVPNFRQTISNSQCTARGGLNSNHGAPLAFASCNPPGFVPGTIAHMGPASSSWASYGVIYGDTNTANGDRANVTLRASLNDIRTAGGADYPASLTLVTKLRISDRFNGGSQSDPATVADFDYSTPVSCASTAGPEGATCNLDTSADAIAAGTIKENKSTVIQVFRLRVNDSGANGIRGDADDRTFANQGIYIP